MEWPPQKKVVETVETNEESPEASSEGFFKKDLLGAVAFAATLASMTPSAAEAGGFVGENTPEITQTEQMLREKGLDDVRLRGGHSIAPQIAIFDAQGRTIAVKYGEFKKILPLFRDVSRVMFEKQLAEDPSSSRDIMKVVGDTTILESGYTKALQQYLEVTSVNGVLIKGKNSFDLTKSLKGEKYVSAEVRGVPLESKFFVCTEEGSTRIKVHVINVTNTGLESREGTSDETLRNCL